MGAKEGEARFRAEKNQRKGATVLVEDLSPSCSTLAPSSIGQHRRNHPVGGDSQRSQKACRKLAERRTRIYEAFRGSSRVCSRAGGPDLDLATSSAARGRTAPRLCGWIRWSCWSAWPCWWRPAPPRRSRDRPVCPPALAGLAGPGRRAAAGRGRPRADPPVAGPAGREPRLSAAAAVPPPRRSGPRRARLPPGAASQGRLSSA